MVWISVGILIVQIAVALVSYFTVYRHRAVYSIKTSVLRMPHGTPHDVYSCKTEHIDEDLSSGKYTILQIIERDVDKDLAVVLEQIKQ